MAEKLRAKWKKQKEGNLMENMKTVFKNNNNNNNKDICLGMKH